MTDDTLTARDSRGLDASATLLVGAAVGLAAAIGFVALQRSRAHARHSGTNTRSTLADYLRDHLTGSDAAIRVASRLRQTHAGSEAGRLFASLSDEFAEERNAVRELLASLGEDDESPKRAAGVVSGRLLAPAADGAPGDLSLFRALEGLAVGVQGKRCLWRTLQSLGFSHPAAEGRSLADFEAMAVRQWDAIEKHRRALGPATFAARPEQERAPARRASATSSAPRS
jgi:hypothetical protein